MNTITAPYTVRLANLSDAPFFIRAQAASQYELDQMDDVEIEFGLASGKLEAYLLIGPHVRMGVTVQREGHRAILAAWYREGPPVGLWTQANILWEKVVDALQQSGVTQVFAYVHRDNPRRDKLMRFYRRLGFLPDMARVERRI